MAKKKKLYFIRKDQKTNEWVVEDETGKEVAASENLSDLKDFTG